MELPNDPIVLLSYVNTQLRDNYEDLQDFCLAQQINKEDVSEKLEQCGYGYDETLHQFVTKIK
jgi:hypothetical protein